MSTVRFVLILLIIAGGFGFCPPNSSTLLAQQLDVEVEDELDEGEDFDEEDEEEEEEAEDEFNYLREVRHDLQHQIERLDDQRRFAQRRIENVSRVMELMKAARELEEKIEAAERTGDKRKLEELNAEFEKLELELEPRHELIEVGGELVEIQEELRFAEWEDEFERVEILERLVDGLREIRGITEELIPIYLNGPESEAGPLEVRKARIFTNKVEKSFRSLQILEQLREAEEEEDEERIAELEGKLEELQKAATDEQSGKESEGEAAVITEELLPVVVTEETLAPFANADLQQDIEPLLRQYCFDCHSNDSSSGELNLEKLLTMSPIVRARDQWINVIEQSKNHVMPPEDGEQPTQEERAKLVLSLHNAVHNFDYSQVDDPGLESARRLTHREYSNTVRDLFGIDIDVVERFPTDLTATSGFDNSANSLFIQPLLMERYVGIAEYVVNAALPDQRTTAEHEAAHKRIFGGANGNDELAIRRVLEPFLRRAYRRSPAQSELDRFTRQVAKAREEGGGFEAAVKATLQSILITPSFLLRTEEYHSEETDPYAVDSWDLASRLSYFLWASMPDDELLDLAESGQLDNPAQLARQVKRMLADEKADTLGTVFTAQWLGSQYLGTRVRLDPIDNPWCTETLMAAMRNETSMFFNSLVKENRPVTELVMADYTFLNQELAKLYNIKGVEGDQLQRVSVDPKKRGGIFGQGSLLAVTSFPGRTSPVVRGKWILDSVLGTPPPPPPPNVSELSEEIEENRRLSFREKLELHREKPNCYACHSQMDPLGFSLEQYDWFGRYRSRRGRRRIDARGELPNGTEFAGLAGLKQVVVEQRSHDLVRQVSQKMLAYALGRQLEYYDEPAIRKIVARAVDEEMRMQTIIREVVTSYPFRYKKNRPTARVADSGTISNLQTVKP